jgi:uncharacterized membrane protein YeaQ/YmgE (transglycosylase-associated protein family)
MSIIWIIVVGFVAGLHPSPIEPSGFMMTTLLGIVGVFLATHIGQAIGWYRVHQGGGFIGPINGAVVVLAIRGYFTPHRA